MPQIVLRVHRSMQVSPEDSSRGTRARANIRKKRAQRTALFPLAGELDQRGQAKVADAEVHVLVEHQVAKFEIAVNDRVGVHVVARADELSEVEPRFGFRVAFAGAEDVKHRLLKEVGNRYELVRDLRARIWRGGGGEGKGDSATHAVGTEFELHIDVTVVFKAVFECDNVRVRHGLMNLDLGKQLRGECNRPVSLLRTRVSRPAHGRPRLIGPEQVKDRQDY